MAESRQVKACKAGVAVPRSPLFRLGRSFQCFLYVCSYQSYLWLAGNIFISSHMGQIMVLRSKIALGTKCQAWDEVLRQEALQGLMMS